MKPPTLPPPAPPRPFAARASNPEFWLIGLIAVQIVCQLALLVEVLAPLRIAFRVSSFALSLVALAAVAGRAGNYPARWPALGAIGILALGVLNPNTNTAIAAVGSILLNLAIVAPVVWATKLPVTPRVLGRVFALLWGFHTASAAIGILQVYYPGTFMPNLSSVISSRGDYAESLKITLTDGTSIYRPMGLTDVPGGAGSAGLNAFLFGMGFLATSRSWAVRGLAVASMGIGMFCVYLSYVRAALLIGVIVTTCFVAVLVAVGRVGAATRIGAVALVTAGLAFAWAASIGGENMLNRMQTLIEERPDEVYYANRGRMLSSTFEDTLPESPFGMGLGRWGMMNAYFGDPAMPDSPPLWVEVQWTAWAVDGGVPLMVAYVLALVIALGTAGRCAALAADPWVAGWGAFMVAYDVATLAMTFSYVPFIAQIGLEFWMLNASLFVVAQRAVRRG